MLSKSYATAFAASAIVFVSVQAYAQSAEKLTCGTTQCQSVEANVFSAEKLICDATQCKTPVKELHQDDIGAAEWTIQFDTPAGVTLDSSKIPGKGVEIEGGGATHYVNFFDAGATWLKCKWHAAKRPGGDNGLTKGFCLIGRAP